MLRELLYQGFFTLGAREVRSFQATAAQPFAGQDRLLIDIVSRNKDSLYGKDHRFASIKTFSDFQSAVPVNDYDSLKPYIMRSCDGEKNILTCEDPFMFATTSGTTGDRKFIPVTRAFIREFRRASVVSGYNLFRQFPSVRQGVALSVFSPAEEGRTRGGIPYGAISGRLYHEEPKLIKRYISPLPYEAFLIKDYESRYYTILRSALALPITVIYTLNPSTILMLGRKLKQYAPQLIRDVREGTINPPEKLPAFVIEALKPFLRPDAGRARELGKLFECGNFSAATVFHNLQMISCWTKAAAAFYLQDFEEHFGATPVTDITYGASEGRGTVTVGPGMQALAVRSHFFEFVEESAWEAGKRETLLCTDLEEGKSYYILFTTSAGLYRYHINDLVKVVGWYGRAPLIEFLHKGGNVSSFTGEKITESQTTEAIKAAMRELGMRVRFFTLIPRFRPEPHYELLVEIDGGEQKQEPRGIAQAFDKALAKANIEYAAKRESQRLAEVEVRLLEDGAYERIRRKMVESGVPDAQIKISHLNPKDAVRAVIEEECLEHVVLR
ncbi:MAG TPA: GH3 auxin-responsive promoter family protein [Candidatus Obscuribacterales bacterium]